MYVYTIFTFSSLILYHVRRESPFIYFQMRSMSVYLEAARYKVGGTLAEVEGSKRIKHPLAEHILVSRDKQGLQQSVLKVKKIFRFT